MLKFKKSFFVIIAIILFSLIILFLPMKTSLTFYYKNSNQIEAILPLQAGDTFEIIFTHSIHLTDVIERYVIQDDLTIRQDEIVYEEFGIGMPANAEEDETFVYEDGKYKIKDLNNVFSEMKIRNGKTVSEHRLLWEETDNKTKMVRMNEYFNPGDWFTVKMERLTMWQYWREVKIHE